MWKKLPLGNSLEIVFEVVGNPLVSESVSNLLKNASEGVSN